MVNKKERKKSEKTVAMMTFTVIMATIYMQIDESKIRIGFRH